MGAHGDPLLRTAIAIFLLPLALRRSGERADLTSGQPNRCSRRVVRSLRRLRDSTAFLAKTGSNLSESTLFGCVLSGPPSIRWSTSTCQLVPVADPLV